MLESYSTLIQIWTVICLILGKVFFVVFILIQSLSLYILCGFVAASHIVIIHP